MNSGPLGQFVDFAYGKGLPARNRRPGPVPVFGSAGVIDSHSEALVEGPGIVVGRKGTIGSVHWTDVDFYPIDTTYFVVPKTNQVKLRFVYYLLKTLPLPKMNTDVAVPGLNRNNALSLKVIFPTPTVQERIADVLLKYDELIQNNCQRIRLLEQSASLLYKEWFVHLRFPGHEHVKIKNGVPEGWEKRPLGDIAPLKYGKALKEDDRIPGEYPVYGSSGIVGTHQKALVTGPAIVVGRKGNVGSVFWSAVDFHPIDTVYYIERENCSLLLHYQLLHATFISTDVAVPGLNRDFAHSRELLIPDTKIIRLFEDMVKPIHEQIDCLQKHNAALSRARYLLLPRLINGEIAV